MYEKPLFLDCETTKKPLHDPFNPMAKLVYVGVYDGAVYTDFDIEYSGLPYGEKLDTVQGRVREADILVGANLKFDLHWLRRYGCFFSDKLVWDVLLAQFILNHQTTPFTSLNDVYAQWGMPPKLDVVKTEYWDKGLDTTDVPEDMLRAYLKQDVVPMQEVFDKQYAAAAEQGMLPLIMLHCQDLLMLEEMEWNGNKYDIAGSRKEAARVLRETRIDTRKLNALAPHKINWGSPDAISLVLYGGTYKYKERETYTFTYKDGSTKEKEHWVVKEMEFPRIVPPPKTARAKEGFWPTDEATLKKLRATGVGKKIVSLLLDLRIKEKLVGTYLKGFPSKYKEAQWEDELLHTNYNQGVAVTGRLSSDKPNVQNNPPVQKKFFISRFY